MGAFLDQKQPLFIQDKSVIVERDGEKARARRLSCARASGVNSATCHDGPPDERNFKTSKRGVLSMVRLLVAPRFVGAHSTEIHASQGRTARMRLRKTNNPSARELTQADNKRLPSRLRGLGWPIRRARPRPCL